MLGTCHEVVKKMDFKHLQDHSHAMGVRTGVQASLYESIVLCKVGGIELVRLEIVVHEGLPRRRQAEDIEAVSVDEVRHLTRCHVR